MLLDNLVKENRVVGIDQAVAPIVAAGQLCKKVFVTVLCALHYEMIPCFDIRPWPRTLPITAERVVRSCFPQTMAGPDFLQTRAEIQSLREFVHSQIITPWGSRSLFGTLGTQSLMPSDTHETIGIQPEITKHAA